MAAALRIALVLVAACSAPPPFDPTEYARQKQGVIENLEPSVPPACYRKAGDTNPCYVCHAGGFGPNTLDDADLQADYAFSEYAMENHWTNLFVDRRAAIASTPEADILAWIRQDNYEALRPFLGDRDLDLAAGFDEDGFARDGSGWRAYRYYPVPGIPSTGDAFIRLPPGADWADVEDALVYPVGTELLHTVRYLDPEAPNGLSRRMKEVRWMKKVEGPAPDDRLRAYEHEANEKSEGKLPRYRGDALEGLVNAFGWRLQGWIEDERGRLRLQTDEEHRFCMGCHQSIGLTIDSTFSFARKAGWGPQDARGLVDPTEARLWRERTGEELGVAPTRAEALARDVAYREIVREQSYVRGRDAVVAPSTDTWRQIDDSVTGAARTVFRDARLQISP